MKQYKKDFDFLIVGAGLSGAMFARTMADKGKSCLVIDRRSAIGGLCHSEFAADIHVHEHGAHIFHTNNDFIYHELSKYTKFNDYKHSVVSIGADGAMYQLPFNLMTFNQLYPETVGKTVDEVLGMFKDVYAEPQDFEEQAINIIGAHGYEQLIKHYTEKQWGRDCKELPAAIIKRLPKRMSYDSTYFNNAKYQGIPMKGYTHMFENMLDHKNIEVHLGLDYRNLDATEFDDDIKIVYTGAIDELHDYSLGKLEYRSVKLVNELHQNCTNYQGHSVINNCTAEAKHTRTIEHRHFDPLCTSPHTIVSTEYSEEFEPGVNEPIYPIGDDNNKKLWELYAKLTEKHYPNMILLGRLAEYKYIDMDVAASNAVDVATLVYEELKKASVK